MLSRVRGPAPRSIDLSTVDPDTWKEVARAAAARGLECLDAPVSGGPVEAGSGKLVFLVGGDAQVLERCRPLLATLGSEIHHVGPLGTAQVVKIVNNVMTMGNVAVAAEAMVLGVKAGMDPQRLFDILSTSGGRSHHFLKRFPYVLAGDFAPRFSIALSRKDLGLAARLAESLGVPMLTTAVVRQVYEAAAAAGPRRPGHGRGHRAVRALGRSRSSHGLAHSPGVSGGAAGPRSRQHGSPVAVSRSGPARFGPPSPRGGWGVASWIVGGSLAEPRAATATTARRDGAPGALRLRRSRRRHAGAVPRRKRRRYQKCQAMPPRKERGLPGV